MFHCRHFAVSVSTPLTSASVAVSVLYCHVLLRTLKLRSVDQYELSLSFLFFPFVVVFTSLPLNWNFFFNFFFFQRWWVKRFSLLYVRALARVYRYLCTLLHMLCSIYQLIFLLLTSFRLHASLLFLFVLLYFVMSTFGRLSQPRRAVCRCNINVQIC